MAEQCKHRRQVGALSSHRCTHKAIRDGYCTRHHPDYISPLQAKANAEHDAEMSKPARQKLLDRIEEAKRDQEKARQEAQAMVEHANECRYAAELALRRFDSTS